MEKQGTQFDLKKTSRWRVASRSVLAAIVPPLVALGLEGLLFASATRWLLFTVALITSSWLGGLKSGIAATILSTALVWWFLVPPERALGMTDPRYYLNVAIFATIGIAIAIFHESLRQARREAAASLSEASRAIDGLEGTTRELSQSQRVLQAVIDYSPGIIAVKDLKGKLLLFNRKLEQALGRDADELRGKTVYDLFPPTAAKRRREADEAVMAAGRPLMLEETVELDDGEHVFLATVFPLRDERRNTFGVCWIEADITARKRAEDELERTAADLKEAQRVAHLGSWYWDLRTNEQQWSEEFFRILGLDPTRPPPRYPDDFSTLLAPENMAALQGRVEKLINEGEPYELELQSIRPEGANRWVAIRGEAVRDPSGEIIAVRGTVQDITHVKELQRLREEWTSVIAHDLRQPIGVIKMSAELLPDIHVGKMSKTEETITARIRSASDALVRMVNDLLDVSRLEAKRLSLERVSADSRKLVHELVERLAQVAAGCHLIIADAGPAATVFVDPGRVEQILGNLISNAVKYGEQHGDIVVRVKPSDGDVEISVTNRGEGIDPEDASRLFTRFSRSKKTRDGRVPGLGLGLYIAKGLVEAHGGRIWVDSVPGKTTTFHFTLPSQAITRVAA